MDYAKAKERFAPIKEEDKENVAPWYDSIDLYQ
jgi:hypothetical protein